MSTARHTPHALRPVARMTAVCCLLSLAACSSVNFDKSLARANQQANAFTQGELALVRSEAQKAAMERTTAELLAQPLTRDNAVRLALVNSPALQALLAQHAADAALAAQGGRIANPVVSLERLVYGSELEIGRSISFGLLDVLTLPQRRKAADAELARQELLLAASVVTQVTQVRQAWVRAVAAQQNLAYAVQVQESANASAELARRMLAVGNFTRLQRARQHAFYADATTQRATAQHADRVAREAISSAGGVRFEALSPEFMTGLPGVFCAGEMLDWEAPTGGYLLHACLATGRQAGQGASAFLARESAA